MPWRYLRRKIALCFSHHFAAVLIAYLSHCIDYRHFFPDTCLSLKKSIPDAASDVSSMKPATGRAQESTKKGDIPLHKSQFLHANTRYGECDDVELDRTSLRDKHSARSGLGLQGSAVKILVQTTGAGLANVLWHSH